MKVIAKNKKAIFNYELIEILEAGIALLGSEVKSIRDGSISLKESYAEIRGGEVFLLNCFISPYNIFQKPFIHFDICKFLCGFRYEFEFFHKL